MAANRWQRAIALLCVASFVLTSCTTLQPVTIPSGESPPSLPAVQPGDRVVVTTKTPSKRGFTVTAVEPDALIGKGVRVPYADMTSLEIERIRKGATTALVVGIVFVVLAIVGVAETGDAFEDALDGPY